MCISTKSESLKERCTDMLKQELSRLDVFPTGSQGRRGIDTEMNRVRQHAGILFDKLEVANEKSIQKANAVVNGHTRTCKTKMTKEIHETLDKMFSVRTPVTIATLQATLDDLYRSLLAELNGMVVKSEIITTTFMEEMEHHKSHLAEELNRRYYLEIRQILSDVGFTAKEDLGKEVALRLDGKLPLSEELIKSEIDESVQQVKMIVAKQLQGWTVLKSDVAAKSMELEKLGDVYAYEYLKRNQDLQKDVTARQAEHQYDDLKSEVVDEFLREIKTIELPTTESKIDAVFVGIVNDLIAEFMSIESTSPTFSTSALFDKLMVECKPDVENQKTLNRLAAEKTDALKIAEKERKAREQEIIESRKKEAQMNELKSFVEKSMEERDSASKQLQDQLRAEAERARQLREEVESMKRQATEAEATKKEVEHRARMQALQDENLRREESDALKKQLEELRMQAAQMELEKHNLQRQAHEDARREEESRQLTSSLDQMRRRAAELEAEKYALEMRARHESARREEAEYAARAAAEVAALSARAAIEAAASETNDVDDEDMENDHNNGTPDNAHRAHRQSESRASVSNSGERKRRKTQSTGSATTRTPGQGLSALEEARLQAKEAMERRIEERASMLSSKKKK